MLMHKKMLIAQIQMLLMLESLSICYMLGEKNVYLMNLSNIQGHCVVIEIMREGI